MKSLPGRYHPRGLTERVNKVTDTFDYGTAFSRNIGWLTQAEQSLLRHKRIAIAGLGGVGGSHLLTLTRLGIGNFHLSDFDSFELPNFNRQAGATVSALNQPKADVLTRMARDINPELDIRVFPQGVQQDNVYEFLENVDLYVDGLDFFAVPARRAVFAACTELGIPAVTAAPLGMGTALLNFIPGKMSFEEYFRLEGETEQEQLLRFLLGLSPAMLQGRYLVDPSTVDLANHRGPSTPMACDLCAGAAATQALKILLGRGKVIAAPWGLHFDAYRNKLVRTWRPGGNRNPLQRLGMVIARRRLGTPPPRRPSAEVAQTPGGTLEHILDLARWAPSGDNTQPWRFEIIDQHHLVVHGRDTRDHVVYDLQGHASQMSLGALLESIAIAASGHGLRAEFQRRKGLPDTTPTFDVYFKDDPELTPSPLIPYLPLRTVQRRPMQTRPLGKRHKQELAESLGPDFDVAWVEGLSGRWQAARLMFRNAGLRLTLPEAYAVHRDVIEWDARYSNERIPDQAVGVDPLTARLMRWTLQSWQRVRFMNRYLAGTLMPRLQLDLIPGLACAGHFALLARQQPESVDDFIAAGRAMQRFWLCATRLGLFIQPEMTPLIFHEYVRDGVPFSSAAGMAQKAAKVSRGLAHLLGEDRADKAVFMGRLGFGPPPMARSLRRPLAQLMYSEHDSDPAAR
ncbi:thiamine biosynthesis protein ThiF [Candidatus Tenderia electrophaga]|uniref:Thiamine biosynthesis protein ThiF n=1 Tax=Candidatus Tenderia electrophaga TaxID=1748243 RepID=A0A0S2TIG7_9GAMM|nr:thiamine biosynthesis protein ThiF [Candidatus Tenderia electrophaga]